MRRAAPLLLLALCALGLGLRLHYALDPVAGSPDSRGYARIAESLHQDGSFAQHGPFKPGEVQEPSNYSPGLPLLAAGIYAVRGDPDLGLARVVLALLGALVVPLGYLLGRRFAGESGGLLAAAPLAIYPALLEYQGQLMTEPLAATLLAALVLAYLRAADEPRSLPRWALTGLALGAMAMVRPEYLMFAAALPLLALLQAGRRASWRAGVAAAAVMAAALLVPVAPWTIRNLLVLDRVVPISTGGGKVLFIGASLEADGDGSQLKQELLERRPRLRRALIAEHPRPLGTPVEPRLLLSQGLPPATGMAPRLRLSQRLVADRFAYLEQVTEAIARHHHPGLAPDEALGRLGRDKLRRNLSGQPGAYLELLARKAFAVWSFGPRNVMETLPWSVLHAVLVVAALLGLAVLAARREPDALLLALLIAGITAVSAVLIASPRRAVVLLPVVCALAAVGMTWAAGRLRERSPPPA